ncbi:ABC transporter substrate-binding protein [Actinomadura xylanilytica]|uniref:ABC transporter substrate-binding protein n=1 Tax=Actinomadura xylanilytica TaxID=887459 RepID=UPI00255B2F2E|nr:extracellular solute-binding protein [Actinomadura xylanilytica]MDL4774353.1 extracellular solute-binding protein [Actinomadura xylanilytica]
MASSDHPPARPPAPPPTAAPVTRRSFLRGSAAFGAVAGLGAIGGGALLTGCSSRERSGPVTELNMHHDAAVGPLFAPYVEYFNAHYKPLKLGTSYVAQDYLTVTNQQLAGGNVSYDVLSADEGYLESWSKNRWITSLDDLPGIGGLLADMNPGVADSLRSPDGKLYALPYFQGAELFAVNTEHLQKIGAGPPATWEEFLEQARELKAKGVSAVPYSPYWIKYAFLAWHQFAAECASEGGGDLFGQDAAPNLKGNAVARATLERWRTLYSEGLVPKDLLTTDYGGITNIFGGGKSSFSLRYQAQIVGWRDPEQSRAAKSIKNVLIPGRTRQTHGFGAHWMLSYAIRSREHAATAMSYLGGPGRDGSYHVPKNLVAIALGLSSGYKSVDRDPAVLASWAKWADVDALTEQLAKAVPLGPVTNKKWYPKFGDMACATLQEVVLGKKSPDEGLTEMSDFVAEQK